MGGDVFASAFAALTGHRPFRWQRRLYAQLLTGDIPAACDIPTGLGKTSIIPLWLIALAQEDVAQPLPCPVIHIVNRRRVDQNRRTTAD